MPRNLSLIAAAALSVATPALATPLSIWGDDEVNVVRVAYRPDDLHTAAGAAKLAYRIRLAAGRVCGGDAPLVAGSSHFQRCRGRAIDRALAALNAPLVADALGRAPAPALAGR